MDNRQKEKLKKGMVFGGLGLLFLLSMWLIFAPSGKNLSALKQGLNDSIPQATTEQLTDNKLKAYELDDRNRREEHAHDEMGRLSDYFSDGTATSPEEVRKQEDTPPAAKIESSVQRYEENNRLLNSFYAPDPGEQEREALRAEIENLKKELAARNGSEDEDEERQLALMEKSYQMAAKYLPQPSAPQRTGNPDEVRERKQQNGRNGEAGMPQETGSVLPLMQAVTESTPTVSSLEQPMSDADFIRKMLGTGQRNGSFHSLNGDTAAVKRNTLRVTVDRTVTLRDGDCVTLRMMEPARVQGLLIPVRSCLTAQARIDGNRMHLLVRSIETDGRIISVKLSAYDTDGQEGVFIPGSENISALREAGAGMGGSLGTSFTFASSARDQIISEAARGLMQGASQLIQKKLRTVRVTLKSGYRLFLVQSK